MRTEILIYKISKEEEDKLFNSWDGFNQRYTYIPIPIKQKLDLYEEFDINLNFLISDVTDIKSKRSSYSKTVTIPDTDHNRLVLGFTSEYGSDDTFNPKLQTRVFVMNDTVTVFDGWLQFKNFKNISGEGGIIYNEIEVQLYSAAYNFYNRLGETKLNELDFSELSENWTIQNIENSWIPSKGKDIYYPLLDYGWGWEARDLSQTKKGVYLENFYPAIHLKTYLNKIFAYTGYRWKSDFFNSQLVNNMIIPYNGGNFMLRNDYSERTIGSTVEVGTFAYNKSFYAGLKTNQQLLINSNRLPTPTYITVLGTRTQTRCVKSNYDVGSVTWEAQSLEFPMVFNNAPVTVTPADYPYNGSNENYHLGVENDDSYYIEVRNDLYKQRFKTGIRLRWSNISGIPSPGGATLTRGKDIIDDKILQVNLILYREKELPSYTPSSWGGRTYKTFTNGCGVETYKLCVFDKNGKDLADDTTWEVGEVESIVPGVKDYAIDITALFPAFSNSTYKEQYLTKPINQYEKVRVSIEIVYKFESVIGATQPEVYADAYNEYMYQDVQSYFTNEIDLTVIPNGKIDVNKIIPSNVKCTELIDNLVTMFNLSIEQDKENEQLLILEPRDLYYSKGIISDWSEKVDLNKDIETQIIADAIKRKNIFSFKDETTDYTNRTYKSISNETYGQYTFDTQNYNSSQEFKINTTFSPAPLVTLKGIARETPKIQASVTSYVKDYATIKSTGLPNIEFGATNWRLLIKKTIYWGEVSGSKTKGLVFNYPYGLPGGGTSKQIKLMYPYAGQFDDPDQPTFDIGFGQPSPVFYGTKENPYYPENNLFSFGWKNMMTDFTDKDSRLVTIYLKLTPKDIADFRFNNKVFLKVSHNNSNLNQGAYFYVQSISEYNPSVEDSYKVELLLIKSANNPSFVIPKTTVSTGSTSPGGPGSSTGGSTSSKSTGGDKTSGSSAGGSYSSISFLPTDVISKRFISGYGNTVPIDKATVLGNNNTIDITVENVTIIGDGMKATQSDVTYTNQQTLMVYDFIDAGQDIVLDQFSDSPITFIDAGEDVVRELGSANTIIFIDAGQDKV